ncbi:DUF3159 domain-containing protein [Saccharopolyspora gregorii]|uniref:DUF3159 domain-containing protein n=1 Tax=Saccharopolyspora gregorii TaxID=33914 RepID=A0ABP6RV25_9PSEU
MSERETPAADHQRPAAEPETGQVPPGAADDAATPLSEKTLLEQMGGVSGLAYSAVPIVVFVLVNAFTGMMPAIWSAIGLAVAIAVWRLVRKEPLQPAISGVLGVAVCSFIAYRSGDAKGFFLLGIWTSLVYGGVFLLSVLARWPLVGVAWSALNSLGFGWRKQRAALRAYDIATLAWVVVFAAKYVVQQWLYNADETAWLGFARIAMGYPLTVLALLVTVWAVRRASKIAQEAADREQAERDAADRAAYARHTLPEGEN